MKTSNLVQVIFCCLSKDFVQNFCAVQHLEQLHGFWGIFEYRFPASETIWKREE